jgi:hypothetical protein
MGRQQQRKTQQSQTYIACPMIALRALAVCECLFHNWQLALASEQDFQQQMLPLTP